MRKTNSATAGAIRLGTLESLARILHAVSARRTAYESLTKRDRALLWRQAEAARNHIMRLNSPKLVRRQGDPESITGHVDRMARISAARTDDTGPTPELLAKRKIPKADVLEKLAANGRLHEVHLKAADEIRRLWIALDRSLSTNTVSLTAPRVDRSRRLTDPLESFGAGETRAYENRYRQWATEAAAAPAGRKRNRAGCAGKAGNEPGPAQTTALTLVLKVVRDNEPPTRLERDMGLPVGRCVAPLLATWLYRYHDCTVVGQTAKVNPVHPASRMLS